MNDIVVTDPRFSDHLYGKAPTNRVVANCAFSFRVVDDPRVGRRDQSEGLRLPKFYAFASGATQDTRAFFA